MSVKQQKWCSLSDAAAELRLGYWQARELLLRGILVGRREGTRWLVSWSSVVEHKANRERAAV